MVVLPVDDRLKGHVGAVGVENHILQNFRLGTDAVAVADTVFHRAVADDTTFQQLGSVVEAALDVGIDIPVIPVDGHILGQQEGVEG